MKSFEKIPNMRKISKNPLLFIWEALYGARKWAIAGVVLAFALQISKVYVPVFFSKMIEYFALITPQELSWRKTGWFLIAIFFAYVGQSVFRMVRELIEENNVRNFMDAKIKLFAVDYLAKHSENYFSSQKSGQLSQKTLNCSNKTTELHRNISRFYSAFFFVLLNFYFIGRVSLWFLLLVFVFGSISAVASYKISFKLRALHKNANDMLDDFNGVVADSIGNSLNIKAGGSEDYEISFVKRIFDKCISAHLAATNKFHDGLRIQRAMLCLFESGSILLLIKMWYQNQISVGDVTLVLMLMDAIMNTFFRHFS